MIISGEFRIWNLLRKKMNVFVTTFAVASLAFLACVMADDSQEDALSDPTSVRSMRLINLVLAAMDDAEEKRLLEESLRHVLLSPDGFQKRAAYGARRYDAYGVAGRFGKRKL